MGSKTTTEDTTAEQTRIVVYLGNRKAIEVLDDPSDVVAAEEEQRAPDKVRAPIKGKRCTTVVFAPDMSPMEAANALINSNGVWANHSDAATPAWIASTDPFLAQLLASHWGGIEIRDPEPDHAASGGEILEG